MRQRENWMEKTTHNDNIERDKVYFLKTVFWEDSQPGRRKQNEGEEEAPPSGPVAVFCQSSTVVCIQKNKFHPIKLKVLQQLSKG